MREITCALCNIKFNTKASRTKRCENCRKLKWKLYKKNKTWENSENGKNYMKKFHIEHKKKHKILVYDYYGWCCKCCGETMESFLSIDHVNNDGNSDRKLKITGVRLYQKIIKENYPDTYQILCMNCNFSKKINKGICQHKL